MKWQDAFTFPLNKHLKHHVAANATPREQLAAALQHDRWRLREWAQTTYEALPYASTLRERLETLLGAIRFYDEYAREWQDGAAFLQWTERAERAARRLQRFHEARCCEDMTEEEAARRHAAAWRAVPPPPPGLFWYEQEDPRGAPLYLLPESGRGTAKSDYSQTAVYVPNR